MKKVICLLFLFIALAQCKNVIAQSCTPCPPVFIIRDSISCNFTDITPQPAGSGPYTNTGAVNSCKNSRMRYTLSANAVCYPTIFYSLVSISGGTIVSFTGNQFVVQWGGSNIGNIVIAFSIPPGAGSAPCRDTMSLNFNLVNSPMAAFTFSPQPACFNNPTNISFNSSASVNALNFFWDFGDGFTSVLPNPVHAYTGPGNYIVTLITTNSPTINGQPRCPACTDSVQHTVVIGNLPGPPITCIASVCAGATETYCTSAAGCVYTWSVNGGVISGGQGTPCVTIIWGSGTPQGSLSLVVSGCPGYCFQGTTVSIPIIPVTGTINGPALVCVNSTTNYLLPAWPGTTYNWSVSGGGVITPFNTNTNIININWTTFGNWIITADYFDSALNCGGSAAYSVSVRPTLNIAGPATICEDLSSTLFATRAPAVPVACNWIISPAGASITSGNGTASINVLWSNPGTYTVTATSVAPNIVCDVANYTVTVFAAPVLTAIIGADSICANQTNVYSVTSNATGSFTWNITNGTPMFLGANNDSVQLTWAASGPYMISVFQTSFPNNCISNTLTKNIFPYPVPAITGAGSVCADNIQTYTITNIGSGNFQWFVTPPSFGTILSGQGTSSVQIKWHGNNSPGSGNIVYLHFGVCNSDSIAITINEPTAATITASGTLCGPGGITLSTGATGTFMWTGVENPIMPPPGNTPSITGINLPGHYNVQIQNFNGTGCTVTAGYFIPDIGRPVAQISATNVLTYCVPAVPNMNLVAANGPGYTFQWYNSAGLIPGATNAVLPINTLIAVGSYTYYCIVSLGGCSVTSNLLTIVISNCVPGGCTSQIDVTGISGCNPFTLTIAATAPAGSTIVPGSETIIHLEDNSTVNSLTTKTYTSTGYKQIRVCGTVLFADMVTTCPDCKDTTVLVNAAADFNGNENCGVISLYDASTTISPAVITSYTWLVGLNPGNTPVPPVAASFNSSIVPNPILTVNQSGSYIVTLIIKVGSCNVIHRDTFNVSVPDAGFNATNSCVGTPTSFNNLFPAPVNFWDFGDMSTSYVSPTTHAYAASGGYLITHIVTDVNGCKDTAQSMIGIAPKPVCTIALSGSPSFCFGDSLFLTACAGLSNYQWYNNGVPIPGAVNGIDTVTQTGNYSFTAININGCIVSSDTVIVTVQQPPNVGIVTSGSVCAGSSYAATVPSCAGCIYQWKVDGVAASVTNQLAGIAGNAPFTTGVHNIKVIVTNPAGCTDSSSITVTFYALPTVSIIVAPNPPQLCSNNLYAMTAVTNAASPLWGWTYNNQNIVLSNSALYTASAAGTYNVKVTDGITGCSNSSPKAISPSPELNLFPIGCDTLCDTSHLFIPLQSLNGNLAGYTIDWYDNAPPYTSVGSGPSFPLSSLMLGNHNIFVIVMAPNGCRDTSNIYSLRTFNCLFVVPVRQIEVSVKQAGSFALVKWSTNMEFDNDHFMVERSLDAIQFSDAGKVMSKGNSTQAQHYSFNDPLTTYDKPIYYRIKAVDKNGAGTFSSIVKIAPVKMAGESITALPNITKDRSEIIAVCNSALKTALVIYSSAGREMRRMPVSLVKGLNRISLNITDLPAGMYMVSVATNEKQLTTRIVRK